MAEQKPIISDKPVEELITDEKVAAARAMIGTRLRPEQYLRDASVDTITDWSNGIGDVNALYRDVEYGRWTRFGSLIAHPCFVLAHHWPGRTRWGLPGVHGFGVGHDFEFFRNIRPGDRINVVERVLGVQEKTGQFSGRMVLQYVEAVYTNQRDEIVAKGLGWCSRHERKAAREKKKYGDINSEQNSPEFLTGIHEKILSEPSRIRGKETRYWEDTQVGEEIPTIVRGPLTLQDTIGFLVGCGRGHTHGLLLSEAMRHPAHYFLNKEAGGGVEYTGIGHHRESVAKEVGVPGMYDYLSQRYSWLCSSVTNWMGDDAFLKRLRAEARRFNVQGDTQFSKGKVTRKYVQDGYALVDLEVWFENQRGEITMPGMATVMLPSRDAALKVPISGAGLDLNAWKGPIL